MSRHKKARKRPIWKLFSWLGAFALTLTALSLVPPASAEGNNGTLKIHEEGTPSGSESNGPKVCRFNVESFGLDVGQTGYIVFEVQGGDEPTGTPAGPFNFGPANVDGFYATQYFDLDDGHYKATLYDNADNEKAKSKVFKVMCDEEPPVINPGGNISVTCTGSGVAHADNFSSTTPFGFEVVVNGVATLYSLLAGEVRDIAFSGAQPGSTVILQDGEANELDSAVVPPKCVEPPLECPAGTQWNDGNGNGVVDQGECAVVTVHPNGDVIVNAGCGFIAATNGEDRVMRFEYGSFGSLDGPDVVDGVRTVQPGETVKITTARQSVDWHASWDFGGLVTRGIDLAVSQDCEPTIHGDAINEQVDNPSFETGLGGQSLSEGGGLNNGLLPVLLGGLLAMGMLLIASPKLARAWRS